MLELPEATTIARQMTARLTGRRVASVTPAEAPPRFAWFTGDVAEYPGLLTGRTITGATSRGGIVDLDLEGRHLVLFDGVQSRHLDAGDDGRGKHVLRLELDDGTALALGVRMYGGLLLEDRLHGDPENGFDQAARRAPSPLGPGFDDAYVEGLIVDDRVRRLPLKAFLATEQRIPGLGNGVLQDILWTAGMHPRRRLNTLDDAERQALRTTVCDVLRAITDAGGRDTETDLTGARGGWATVMCRAALSRGCPRCGGEVERSTYLGGAVYVCPTCQPRP